MNKYAVFHSIESSYSFPIQGKRFVIRLRVDKKDSVDHCYLLFNAKHRFYAERKEKEMVLH